MQSEDVKNVVPETLLLQTQDLIVDEHNAHLLDQCEVMKIDSDKYWHRFQIKNGASLDKEKTLRTIMEAIDPITLVPVNYTVTADSAYFFARNCNAAIWRFCSMKLSIATGSENDPIVLSIHMCHTLIDKFRVNMKYLLKQAIEKRYDKTRPGYIDLSQFHKDSELLTVLFCPLSLPRILFYVLGVLKQTFAVHTINLSKNGIKDLKSLKALQQFNGLINLDLSNNQINEMNSLIAIGNSKLILEEISLDNNPLCAKYSTPLQYVKDVLRYIPTLKRLDGMNLRNGVPNYQIWLCTDEASCMVNQFLQHYFKLYDNQRHTLVQVYHDDSTLTLTGTGWNRTEDVSIRSGSPLILGNKNIIEALLKLPHSQHDQYSFKIDLPVHGNFKSVLMVTGLFKEIKSNQIKSFNRTFVLVKMAPDEYKILHELYSIMDADTDEIEYAFCFGKDINENYIPKLNAEERPCAIKTIATLTTMNSKYSEKCLKDVDWDLKRALEAFLHHHKASNIPYEAFS